MPVPSFRRSLDSHINLIVEPVSTRSLVIFTGTNRSDLCWSFHIYEDTNFKPTNSGLWWLPFVLRRPFVGSLPKFPMWWWIPSTILGNISVDVNHSWVPDSLSGDDSDPSGRLSSQGRIHLPTCQSTITPNLTRMSIVRTVSINWPLLTPNSPLKGERHN